MFKRVVFTIIVLIALTAGVFWFFYTEKINAPISNAINAIPENASIIIESKKASTVWKKISETNIVWEELLGIKAIKNINDDILSVDSLIQTNIAIQDVLKNQSLFFSFHKTEKKQFELLVSFSLPDLTYQSKADNFLKAINNQKEIIFENYKSQKIGFLSNTGKFYFSWLNGTIVLSKDKSLILKSIDQGATQKTILNNPNFQKIIRSAGKSVEASVFINYKELSHSLLPFVSLESQINLETINKFSGFSGWDFSIKPNAILCNGFTYSNDSLNNFLSIFKGQEPQSIEIQKVLPSRISFLLTYELSNKQLFFSKYEKLLSKIELKNQKIFFENFSTTYKMDLKFEIQKILDNEMGLAVIESKDDLKSNSFAVIRSVDVGKSLEILNDIQKKIKENSEEKTDSAHFQSYTISQIQLPGMLKHVFGNLFESIEQNYYTAVGDYIIFSNSIESMKLFITDFENKKTLANDKNYKMYSENIASEANFYMYSSITRSTSFYASALNEKLKSDFIEHLSLFKKFEAFSVQFSPTNNDLFYSNIYLKYNPLFKKETETLWELPIDTTITLKPYLVLNHNTKAREIFIQDDANKIYLISNTGKILWTKQLPEKIMSDIIQIDVYKNDKLQLLFNTRSNIYLYDRNGNEMKGFPLKLKSPATNAVSVVDYENNKDYRLFIATANKRIVCYKANGEQVTAFGFDKTDEEVFLPVYFFNTNAKDHICFVDVKGKVYVVNRQGEVRIKMKEKLPQGIKNYFLDIGKDYSKSAFVAADTLGNIVRLTLTGMKDVTKLQDFETSPYFEFRDLNNDKIKEYILLTRSELKVFAQDKTLLFQHLFQEKISSIPMIFNFRDGTAKIGVVSDATNQLFLFNENGAIYNQFPISGSSMFSIGDLNNQGVYNVVTGSKEKAIYVYQLH